MSITIVSNVELVATRRAEAHRESKYPWGALIEAGVGAGFPVPTDIKEKGFRTLATKQGIARHALFSVGRTADGTLMVVYKGARKGKADAAAQEAAAQEAAADEASGVDTSDEAAELGAEEVAY